MLSIEQGQAEGKINVTWERNLTFTNGKMLFSIFLSLDFPSCQVRVNRGSLWKVNFNWLATDGETASIERRCRLRGGAAAKREFVDSNSLVGICVDNFWKIRQIVRSFLMQSCSKNLLCKRHLWWCISAHANRNQLPWGACGTWSACV